MHSLWSLLNLAVMLTIKSGVDRPMSSGLRSWASLFLVPSLLCTGLIQPRAIKKSCKDISTRGDIGFLSTPRTCGRSTKTQGDLANVEQCMNKVDVVWSLALVLYLNITGAMAWSVRSRRCAQIYSCYWTALMCWYSFWSSEYFSREENQFRKHCFWL